MWMKLKRIIAILFLTLTSMIMLVYTSVPHHHHQAYICFNQVHQEDEQHGPHHPGENTPGHHPQNCLQKLFQAQISRIQSLRHSCHDGHCHHFILIPFLVPEFSALPLLEIQGQISPTTYYRERLHESTHISRLGGRAPPHFDC